MPRSLIGQVRHRPPPDRQRRLQRQVAVGGPGFARIERARDWRVGILGRHPQRLIRLGDDECRHASERQPLQGFPGHEMAIVIRDVTEEPWPGWRRRGLRGRPCRRGREAGDRPQAGDRTWPARRGDHPRWRRKMRATGVEGWPGANAPRCAVARRRLVTTCRESDSRRPSIHGGFSRLFAAGRADCRWRVPCQSDGKWS